MLETVRTEYGEYDAVYTKQIYSGKGDLLLEADDKRDAPFSGFKFILKGHFRVSGSPHLQDAKDIYAIIEKYGIDIDRYKYAEESALMKKMLEELDYLKTPRKLNACSSPPL